ncbi:transcriptional regulator, TetR family [Roseovarius tolerans]|uniref:Transcriptional regulator, TetR family n=1 Tax=Roseovarius tolerans TaxID=74031 RepID=A0A1H8D9Q5_9RHOB|nr:TetR/AcrR family transcriptional regulator [Roseovarius tolerans]SEN03845.1 transcriptional regulator, TetR family [Roseovarius tolerans]
MGRPALVQDDDLLQRLSLTFRDVGFEAASMAILSERTGLKRPSLYHRFPGGKEQMAQEVLTGAHDWLDKNILQVLRSDSAPEDRINDMIKALDRFYEGGRRACLLNMLSSPSGEGGRFADAVHQTLTCFIEALGKCVEDSGRASPEAKAVALKAVSLIQGSLVVSRGLGTTSAFEAALEDLPNLLLTSESATPKASRPARQ